MLRIKLNHCKRCLIMRVPLSLSEPLKCCDPCASDPATLDVKPQVLQILDAEGNVQEPTSAKVLPAAVFSHGGYGSSKAVNDGSHLAGC